MHLVSGSVVCSASSWLAFSLGGKLERVCPVVLLIFSIGDVSCVVVASKAAL